MESVPALDIRGLTVFYGSVPALRDASLTVGHGRILGLVGANGSGKSTLMKAALGLVRPAAGTVAVDGLPVARARKLGRIAYVGQSSGTDRTFPLTVADVVLTGRYGRLRPPRRPGAADREAVTAALARMELDLLGDRQIGQLSGGQRKRAFVARALVQEAGLILLDEPLAGVDNRSADLIIGQLRDLAAAGAGLLVVDHDLPRLDTFVHAVHELAPGGVHA